MEIAALIHFNMASTGNCSEPSAFHPEKLDTDNWVQSFEAFGAREAVLVAKHACGFCTWPSNATLPVANASRGQSWRNGSRYPYSVAYSPWLGFKGDVVKSFLQSVTKAGLGAGYYYSLGNQLKKSLNLSAAQIIEVEQQQLTELWTTYGNNGNLSEVWFLRRHWIRNRLSRHCSRRTSRNGDAKTIAECCAACSKLKGCALFVAAPNSIDGTAVCCGREQARAPARWSRGP